jgi:hypothetical protein
MAVAIFGKAGAAFELTLSKDEDLTVAKKPITIAGTSWTYGTGANQVNCIFADQRTLADGANETLDLYGGALYDIWGAALTMASLKLLYVKNNSSDAGLKILGTAVTGLDIVADPSDIILIAPGGTFIWVNPSAAGTDTSTNKDLKLEHDGTGSSSMAVDVIALGLD